MVKKKSWKEFRESGLLFAVNQFLHIFGYAIILKFEGGEIVEVYPARVKYRGFTESGATKGYKDISKYMLENSRELEEESRE